ncbi:MAG TPA: HAD-IA family hydrolase [Myxococcota bacterium]|nr:HAD-IA family hydrolase [Myxococcota bacterium]HRY94253.1 HAD-IA family hydrolase [Myxococcota bacterium]HSA20950.1 HAD-IA family hydrolase [Myxococcota bacterium]
MAPRFDFVLFDLDGTLVDSSGDLTTAVNAALAELDLPPLTRADIVSFVGDGARKLLERTLARFGRTEVDEAVRLFKAAYRLRCLDETRPYPGVPALLEALCSLPLGVVSNKPAEFARQVLDGLGLSGRFGAVVGGDEAALKPNPAPLHLAMARLGVAGRRGLMVGDHTNDLGAGRAAGLATCGVTWGLDGGRAVRADRADFLCSVPAEVERLVLA